MLHNFADQKLNEQIRRQNTKTKTLKTARKIRVPEKTEKNGVAERFHRTVVEAARCLPMDSKLPKR